MQNWGTQNTGNAWLRRTVGQALSRSQHASEPYQTVLCSVVRLQHQQTIQTPKFATHNEDFQKTYCPKGTHKKSWQVKSDHEKEFKRSFRGTLHSFLQQMKHGRTHQAGYARPGSAVPISPRSRLSVVAQPTASSSLLKPNKPIVN